MIITIKYESDTLIPKEWEVVFKEFQKRVLDDRYEPDKIICDLSYFRSSILKWIVNHSEVKK